MGLYPEFPRDENLRPYATDRQWSRLEALWETGSGKSAAKKMGVTPQVISEAKLAVLRKAAKRGYSPVHNLTQEVPDGYKLRGTSTLYRSETGEPVLQWVKTTEDQERQEILQREVAAAFAGQLDRLPPTDLSSTKTSDHLIALYPIGDHHLGMYSWHEEAGGDYDLGIGEQLLHGAISHLVAATPACDRAAILVLGDFMHYDSMIPETPTNRNKLDADSRYAKMVRTAIRCLRRAIEAALKRHRHVHVVVEIGNHDLASSIFLAECLANVYENEPRVEIDRSPRHFHYLRFGACLIGVHHGHGVKLDKLPLIMASDRPEDWGATKHRYWFTGHIHVDRVVDVQGVRVESCRVLPPTDAWAANSGYRPGQGMSAIVLHQDHGEVARYTVNPGMLAAKKDD